MRSRDERTEARPGTEEEEAVQAAEPVPAAMPAGAREGAGPSDRNMGRGSERGPVRER